MIRAESCCGPRKREFLPSPLGLCSPLVMGGEGGGQELYCHNLTLSIQLREENGRYHSFFKRDLEAFKVLKKSLMPENYSEQLNVKQLHDVFAFLMTLE